MAYFGRKESHEKTTRMPDAEIRRFIR